MSTDRPSSDARERHVRVSFSTMTRPGARLTFDNGMEQFRVQACSHPDVMFEGYFADPVPHLWATHQNIHLDYPLGTRLLGRRRRSIVKISTAVPWTVDVHGGAAHIDADLSDVQIEGMAFHSSLSRSRIVLGRPRGEIAIRLSSVGDVRFDVPADVPVRLCLSGASSNVVLDKVHHAAGKPGFDRAMAGYSTARDRFLFVASAGVDNLVLSDSPISDLPTAR